MSRQEHPEGAVVRVEEMGPVERAYAEAMHEDCTDGPPHPLSAHSPWTGGDLDGVEPWSSFVACLARHGLRLIFADADPELVELRRWHGPREGTSHVAGCFGCGQLAGLGEPTREDTEQDVTGDPEADADQFLANMGHIQEGSRCGCVVAGGPFGGTGAHKPMCPVGAEWDRQRRVGRPKP